MPIADEIKSRLDILDVVSQYVALQRSGRSYKALCPFHPEKTPSFFVFPERQSWRCFGACATGGDVFSFAMRIENLDFSAVLKNLANLAGVKLPERGGRKGQFDFLYQANEAALGFFSGLLNSNERGSSARAYLQKRGLSQGAIERFQLGLSPADGESLVRHLASKGYKKDQLVPAGLATQAQNGGYRDLFQGRLMFPIRDSEGRLAGFGGRALGDFGPKYLNTPRTPVFDKGHILYGLHLAKEDIRKDGAVIVEGYMDAIAAHHHGFSNVVASMGTALTQQQVSLVRSLVSGPGAGGAGRVVLALDPDTAGQEATLRSLESSWRVFQTRPISRVRGATVYERWELPSLNIAPLPQGKDPAEIILESPQEWATIVNAAVPLMDYLYSALASRIDLREPQGKARFAELLFPLIAASPDPFQQDYYFQRLAAYLGVSEVTLQASLGRPSVQGHGRGARPGGSAQSREGLPGPIRATEAAVTPFDWLEHDPLEEYCLALLIMNPRLMRGRERVSPGEGRLDDSGAGDLAEDGQGIDGLVAEYFQRAANREIFTIWMKCSTLDVLREGLDDALLEHLDDLLAKPLPPSDLKEQEVASRYCVRRLEERYLRELKKEEELRLADAAQGEFEEQEQDILKLNERLRHIFRG